MRNARRRGCRRAFVGAVLVCAPAGARGQSPELADGALAALAGEAGLCADTGLAADTGDGAETGLAGGD
ncbi:hypothetical protein [Occultella kanbiaonis]|uniref:hypothetical protein n=1 Tax=Occultella kanbiaonis TaxID=2675754 RepID=UPI0013D1D34B|nr:hypothetical protein [Occultella kanbiaonis]